MRYAGLSPRSPRGLTGAQDRGRIPHRFGCLDLNKQQDLLIRPLCGKIPLLHVYSGRREPVQIPGGPAVDSGNTALQAQGRRPY
jgi:hypothetical protein